MPLDFPALFQFIAHTLTLFFMLMGLFGLIIPVFPGLTVMWLSTLVFAIIQSASGLMPWWDWLLFALITLLMIGGNIVDNIIIASKMRGHEIPWRNILICYAIGILFSLFLTPLAGLVASPLSLLGLEYLRFRDKKLAFESAKVFMIGWGAAFAARFGIGILMIIFWMLWAWL
jgi:uncharacterized protein YqgC (DUF456 family)